MISQKLRNQVFEVIRREWPINISEICQELSFDIDSKEKQKKAVSRVSYHVKKLEKEEMIRLKRLGRSLVVWPSEIEKLRVLHDLMRYD